MMPDPTPHLQQELEQWHRRIRSQPDQPTAYIQRGMVYFKLAQIDASIQDFDRAEQLQPAIAPYLWQRGLSYYYAHRFAEGAKQFELDLNVNAQDAEETLWRYLCLAQMQGSAMARPSLPASCRDARPVLQWIYKVFAGVWTPAELLAIATPSGHREQFYSHLYLGLYYEAENDPVQARTHLVKAVNEFSLEDYMWYLSRVHLMVRGWND